MSKRIVLRNLAFTGPGKQRASLDFGENLTLVWGASNTGKSFSVEAIDFMLGAKDPPQPISESEGYDEAWLEIILPKLGSVTLSRSLAGGAFGLYAGRGIDSSSRGHVRTLAAKNNASSDNNLSALLLGELGLRGKLIADNIYGHKRPLSFRDLANTYLGDETNILSSWSPVEGGQNTQRTAERSTFRLMLSGLDDSAIISVDDPKKFQAAKSVRLELIDELLCEVNNIIGPDLPDGEELQTQLDHLESHIERSNADFTALQGSIRELLDEKQSLARLIPKSASRLDEVSVQIDRFKKLQDVYRSDIARLESLEEAGFILSLTAARDCSLCGAEPSAQVHAQDRREINLVQEAALVEIEKIRKQSGDLAGVTDGLRREKIKLSDYLPTLHERLTVLETQIDDLTPRALVFKSELTYIIQNRDQIKRSLELLSRRAELLERRSTYEQTTAGKKSDRPVLAVANSATYDFAQTVSHVLAEWGFPGKRHVSFDDVQYDLKIDGKPRIANGKGVRAVTHAAFKVALLLYCREHELPHPGFLILDTPLLTYRDPLKASKHGALAPDEVALAQTSLKDRFFEHLASLRADAQFIVLENVDPPAGLEERAHVELFSGDDGRRGLFPN